MSCLKVIQGASVNLRFGLKPPSDLSVGWVCRVEVVLKSDGVSGTPAISKTLTDLSANNFYFTGKLTPTETASLSPGRYILMVELDNAGDELNQEYHEYIDIEAQGIA